MAWIHCQRPLIQALSLHKLRPHRLHEQSIVAQRCRAVGIFFQGPDVHCFGCIIVSRHLPHNTEEVESAGSRARERELAARGPGERGDIGLGRDGVEQAAIVAKCRHVERLHGKDPLVHLLRPRKVLPGSLEKAPVVVKRGDVRRVDGECAAEETFCPIRIIVKVEAQQAVAAQNMCELGVRFDRALEQLLGPLEKAKDAEIQSACWHWAAQMLHQRPRRVCANTIQSSVFLAAAHRGFGLGPSWAALAW